MEATSVCRSRVKDTCNIQLTWRVSCITSLGFRLGSCDLRHSSVQVVMEVRKSLDDENFPLPEMRRCQDTSV